MDILKPIFLQTAIIFHSLVLYLQQYTLVLNQQLPISYLYEEQSEDYSLFDVLFRVYYTEGPIDTDMPVSCTTFLEFLSSAISYIEIKEKIFQKDFLMNLVNRKNVEVNKFLDVRYRIEIGDMIICIKEWGYFCINGNYKGKLENFQLLFDYIDRNEQIVLLIK